jgi:hypothetical protein
VRDHAAQRSWRQRTPEAHGPATSARGARHTGYRNIKEVVEGDISGCSISSIRNSHDRILGPYGVAGPNGVSRFRSGPQTRLMKTTITLKLDAALLRKARVLAGEQGRSVRGLLTDQLEWLVSERDAFGRARRRALARLGKGFDLDWTSPRSRDESHE